MVDGKRIYRLLFFFISACAPLYASDLNSDNDNKDDSKDDTKVEIENNNNNSNVNFAIVTLPKDIFKAIALRYRRDFTENQNQNEEEVTDGVVLFDKFIAIYYRERHLYKYLTKAHKTDFEKLPSVVSDILDYKMYMPNDGFDYTISNNDINYLYNRFISVNNNKLKKINNTLNAYLSRYPMVKLGQSSLAGAGLKIETENDQNITYSYNNYGINLKLHHPGAQYMATASLSKNILLTVKSVPKKNDKDKQIYGYEFYVWNLNTYRRMKLKVSEDSTPYRAFALSPKGDMLALGKVDGSIDIIPTHQNFSTAVPTVYRIPAPIGGKAVFIKHIEWHQDGLCITAREAPAPMTASAQENAQQALFAGIMNWFKIPSEKSTDDILNDLKKEKASVLKKLLERVKTDPKLSTNNQLKQGIQNIIDEKNNGSNEVEDVFYFIAWDQDKIPTENYISYLENDETEDLFKDLFRVSDPKSSTVSEYKNLMRTSWHGPKNKDWKRIGTPYMSCIRLNTKAREQLTNQASNFVNQQMNKGYKKSKFNESDNGYQLTHDGVQTTSTTTNDEDKQEVLELIQKLDTLLLLKGDTGKNADKDHLQIAWEYFSETYGKTKELMLLDKKHRTFWGEFLSFVSLDPSSSDYNDKLAWEDKLVWENNIKSLVDYMEIIPSIINSLEKKKEFMVKFQEEELIFYAPNNNKRGNDYLPGEVKERRYHAKHIGDHQIPLLQGFMAHYEKMKSLWDDLKKRMKVGDSRDRMIAALKTDNNLTETLLEWKNKTAPLFQDFAELLYGKPRKNVDTQANHAYQKLKKIWNSRRNFNPIARHLGGSYSDLSGGKTDRDAIKKAVVNNLKKENALSETLDKLDCYEVEGKVKFPKIKCNVHSLSLADIGLKQPLNPHLQGSALNLLDKNFAPNIGEAFTKIGAISYDFFSSNSIIFVDRKGRIRLFDLHTGQTRDIFIPDNSLLRDKPVHITVLPQGGILIITQKQEAFVIPHLSTAQKHITNHKCFKLKTPWGRSRVNYVTTLPNGNVMVHTYGTNHGVYILNLQQDKDFGPYTEYAVQKSRLYNPLGVRTSVMKTLPKLRSRAINVLPTAAATLLPLGKRDQVGRVSGIKIKPTKGRVITHMDTVSNRSNLVMVYEEKKKKSLDMQDITKSTVEHLRYARIINTETRREIRFDKPIQSIAINEKCNRLLVVSKNSQEVKVYAYASHMIMYLQSIAMDELRGPITDINWISKNTLYLTEKTESGRLVHECRIEEHKHKVNSQTITVDKDGEEKILEVKNGQVTLDDKTYKVYDSYIAKEATYKETKNPSEANCFTIKSEGKRYHHIVYRTVKLQMKKGYTHRDRYGNVYNYSDYRYQDYESKIGNTNIPQRYNYGNYYHVHISVPNDKKFRGLSDIAITPNTSDRSVRVTFTNSREQTVTYQNAISNYTSDDQFYNVNFKIPYVKIRDNHAFVKYTGDTPRVYYYGVEKTIKKYYVHSPKESIKIKKNILKTQDGEEYNYKDVITRTNYRGRNRWLFRFREKHTLLNTKLIMNKRVAYFADDVHAKKPLRVKNNGIFSIISSGDQSILQLNAPKYLIYRYYFLACVKLLVVSWAAGVLVSWLYMAGIALYLDYIKILFQGFNPSKKMAIRGQKTKSFKSRRKAKMNAITL